MANTPSARKRARQSVKRAAINRMHVSRIRSSVRKVEEAVAVGNYDSAREAFAAAEPLLRRGVGQGVLHLNTVSRKISRLSRRVKALAQTAA